MEQEYFESLYPEATRNEEIKKILSFTREGKSCQVISIPGAGRSTLLGLLAYNTSIRRKHLGDSSKNTHFVMVNFSEIRKRPLFDVVKFLFLSLCDSLRARKMEEYKKINMLFKESLGFNDELVLFQSLKEAIDYLTLEKKLSVVMLFDRFEEYVPTVESEFFTNMRTLRARAKYHFSIIFSLNRPLEALLDPSILSDFYDFVAENHIYLPLFDKETTDFRISYIEKVTGKKIPKEVLERIIDATGGSGKLIKLASEAIISRPEPIEDLNKFLLSQKPIQATLREIWVSLLPSEQADLKSGKFDDVQVEEYLEKTGLIKNKIIQIPLFSDFLNSQTLKNQTGLGKIIYDENTNSVRVGDTIISDQLTSSEFRLLKFLLQNPDKIVERDEIIGVVWSSVKSTAGITDQAVDQLIFRLRRKIEEDANSPIHLLTIKGRGFKFVA